MDESNLEVIGANVKEKGTANGAITDMNGVFHLKVSNLQKAVLQISFMGYEPQEVPLNGRKQLKIILKETANELQEVTVVAYGTQKKETLTGAISAVSNDALVRSPNASVANTLAGQITGLSSVQTSGQPGQEDPKVFIRGVGSLTESASSPLILVDGVERSFYQMDPNEIESVTVLKDASATAVFGVRGANGVILVTTRRGNEGKAKISVNSSVGIQMPTRMLEMADSYTYATLRNEIITNDKPNATENDLVFDNYAVERFRLNDDPIMYPSIDWRRYLLNKTSVQTHEGAVGVLGEVLVARGVQDVDAVALVLELHDGGGDRDAALLLNLHPVGGGGPGVLFALDLPGLGNGPAVEQEFLGQGGLAGVRVADDGKGAPAIDFFLVL